MSDCSVWNLQWPTNPFLMCLKESYNLPAVQLMSLEKSLGYTTVPAKRAFCQKVGNLLGTIIRFKCFTLFFLFKRQNISVFV